MNAGEFFGAMVVPLRQLADFSGRATRGQFWPFVFLIYAAQQIVAMILITPSMTAFQTEAARNPALVDQAHVEMLVRDMISSMGMAIVVLSALWLVMIAAALVRRLHDGGRSGYWALPSLALQLSSLGLVWWGWTAFTSGDQDSAIAAIVLLVVNNMVGLAFSILLIIWCAQDGTIGPNAYGPDPKGRVPGASA